MLLHHNIATFQVMFTRAQRALSVHAYTQETRQEGKDYSSSSTKISSLLQAMTWIAREHRQWIRLLANKAVCTALGLSRTAAKGEAPGPLSLGDIMKPIIEKTEDILEDALKEEAREREERQRRKRRPPEFDGLDPQLAT